MFLLLPCTTTHIVALAMRFLYCMEKLSPRGRTTTTTQLANYIYVDESSEARLDNPDGV